MKPYYQDDYVTIYNCDCRDILGELPDIDISVSSPPYNTLPTSNKPSGLHAERATGINKWIKKSVEGYADNMPECEYQRWIKEIYFKVYDKCKGLMWINHKIRFRDKQAVHPLSFLNWPLYSEIIWNRKISMALNCKRYAPSHEGVWGFGLPHYWNDELNTNMSVWDIAPQREETHPCPFPIELVKPLILSSCPPNGIVLDPFAGSCTTGRAAKDLGRKCICIECEEKFAEIGAKRMCQEVMDFN